MNRFLELNVRCLGNIWGDPKFKITTVNIENLSILMTYENNYLIETQEVRSGGLLVDNYEDLMKDMIEAKSYPNKIIKLYGRDLVMPDEDRREFIISTKDIRWLRKEQKDQYNSILCSRSTAMMLEETYEEIYNKLIGNDDKV